MGEKESTKERKKMLLEKQQERERDEDEGGVEKRWVLWFCSFGLDERDGWAYKSLQASAP